MQELEREKKLTWTWCHWACSCSYLARPPSFLSLWCGTPYLQFFTVTNLRRKPAVIQHCPAATARAPLTPCSSRVVSLSIGMQNYHRVLLEQHARRWLFLIIPMIHVAVAMWSLTTLTQLSLSSRCTERAWGDSLVHPWPYLRGSPAWCCVDVVARGGHVCVESWGSAFGKMRRRATSVVPGPWSPCAALGEVEPRVRLSHQVWKGQAH